MLEDAAIEYKLVFVNDASSGPSLELLREPRQRNLRIKMVNTSRRFGASECLFTGMDRAAGEAVISPGAVNLQCQDLGIGWRSAYSLHVEIMQLFKGYRMQPNGVFGNV